MIPKIPLICFEGHLMKRDSLLKEPKQFLNSFSFFILKIYIFVRIKRVLSELIISLFCGMT